MVISRLTEAGGRPSPEELFDLLVKDTYKGVVRSYTFDKKYRWLESYEVFRYEVKGGRYAYAGKVDV